jgi:hypothetical protein
MSSKERPSIDRLQHPYVRTETMYNAIKHLRARNGMTTGDGICENLYHQKESNLKQWSQEQKYEGILHRGFRVGAVTNKNKLQPEEVDVTPSKQMLYRFRGFHETDPHTWEVKCPSCDSIGYCSISPNATAYSVIRKVLSLHSRMVRTR